MSDNPIPKEFWERADGMIDLANQQVQTSTRDDVSTSLLYAAARFNAFEIASSAQNLAEIKKDRALALKFYMDQYEKMLIENLDDYIDNYETYMSSS